MTEIPDEIRSILACPQCRGPLRDSESQGTPTLVCETCALAYPVEEGIPVLLVERASAQGQP